jgi:cytidyltransferase-like protein
MNGWSQVRIWMDGAFDMLHYGHMNAFRQGRAYGTYLVVGVNSDGAHSLWPRHCPLALLALLAHAIFLPMYVNGSCR